MPRDCQEPKRTHDDHWWKLFLMDLPSLKLSYPGCHAFQLPITHFLLHDVDNVMLYRANMFILWTWEWNGMAAVFSGVGRIFLQDRGTQTPWVSCVWERKLPTWKVKATTAFQDSLAGRALPASMAQRCRMIMSWIAARPAMPWGQAPVPLQSFWQGRFGSLLCLQGPDMLGSLQALGWGSCCDCRRGREMILWLSC